MNKTHQVIVNGETFSARRGEVLLDAALTAGIHIPHDCRSGHCGSCRVSIVSGALLGGDVHEAKACQCRVIADVAVAVEEVPEVTSVGGRVSALDQVAPDVVELSIELHQPLEYLPGQYLQVQFRGYPSRCYSPTVPLDRFGDPNTIHLHVRRVPGGRVSSALGAGIRVGRRVKLTGPFGSAFLRLGMANPLVLVAGGTGFAPIWSIADAAMRENYQREVVLLVGARTIESLYMIPALWRLASCPNVTIVPVTARRQTANPVVQAGSPADYLPSLHADHIVYVAGPPNLVNAVTDIARANGVICYADAFAPNVAREEGVLVKAMNWFSRDGSMPSPAIEPSRARR
jgi:3-phenylpropionate/trans-cinnamate dioxygenase ferredoxin reductase subunit